MANRRLFPPHSYQTMLSIYTSLHSSTNCLLARGRSGLLVSIDVYNSSTTALLASNASLDRLSTYRYSEGVRSAQSLALAFEKEVRCATGQRHVSPSATMKLFNSSLGKEDLIIMNIKKKAQLTGPKAE